MQARGRLLQHEGLILQLAEQALQQHHAQHQREEQGHAEAVAEEGRAKVDGEHAQRKIQHRQRGRDDHHIASAVQVIEHVEHGQQHHLEARRYGLHQKQRDVEAADADPRKQRRHEGVDRQQRERLHLQNLIKPLAHHALHAVVIAGDVLQRAAFAHGGVELVVPLDEVGLELHQKNAHARDDAQIGEKHRQVVNGGSAQRPDDRGGRAGGEPEGELVRPHAQVVEHAARDEREIHLPRAEAGQRDGANHGKVA